MLYMIVGHDGPDALARRALARPEHLSRLKALADQGRLVLAGPLPAIDADDPGPAGYLGSLVVAEFDSLEAAQAWVAEDPYLLNGAWQGAETRPFKAVLP